MDAVHLATRWAGARFAQDVAHQDVSALDVGPLCSTARQLHSRVAGIGSIPRRIDGQSVALKDVRNANL